MKSSKNITLVTSLYWPELVGSGPYCADIAEALANAGHRVTVLTCRPHYPSQAAFLQWQDGSRDSETWKGVSVRRTAAGKRVTGKLLERLTNDLKFLWFLLFMQEETKTCPPDIFISLVPSSFAALAGRILSSRCKSEHIVIVHDIESGLAKSLNMAGANLVLSLIQALERISLKRTSQIITLTDAMGHILRQNGVTGKITTVPIWAEIPEPEIEQSKSQHFTLMYSGNFGKKQNLNQLLPLFERLQAALPDVRVVMNGEGTERAMFEHAVRTRGLANTVLGDFVPKEDLVQMLRSADLHIVPQADGTSDYLVPSKVTSIMAAGRPFLAIGPQTGALADLARDSGAGIVLTANDLDGFEDTIRRLGTSRETIAEMGKNGAQYVAQHFSKNDILDRYVGIVEFNR